MTTPGFPKLKKSKRGFSLLPEKQNSFHCFAASGGGGRWHRRKSGTTKLLPWELHSTLSRHRFELSLSICAFFSIYFVHPLARCVLRYQKTLRDYFGDSGLLKFFSIIMVIVFVFFTSAEERFHRTLLSDMAG